ncbi:unnamed protein product [Ectocarpus sp. 6 AP-2014]
MMNKMNFAALLGVVLALAGSVGAQTCAGGISGVESTSLDVCCTLECGTCGGVGCTPANTSSLTANDCCATEISESGVMCSDTGVAPCILSTVAASADSVCDNGQTGVQDPDTDVCCPLECGESCGGEGCGTIPGVDASQCCASIIEQSGIVCGDGIEAPCTQVAVAVADSVCSNGFPGIENEDASVCCDAACNVCGGSTCGNVAGLTGADCCTGTIITNDELCSVKGSAPCVVDPPEVTASTCANGLAGVSSGSVCCAEACNGVCGGEGCGNIAGTNGAEDCCSATILAANIACVDTAPCVMVEGTFTPAPAVVPTVAATTMAPLAPGETVTMAPTPTSQTAAPTPGSRDLDFGTGVPTPAPTSAEEAGMSSAPTAGSRDLDLGESMAPTAGSRDLDLGTAGPSAVGDTMAPSTAPPGAATAGSAALSAGSVVTVAAMAGGMFAVLAATRN